MNWLERAWLEIGQIVQRRTANSAHIASRDRHSATSLKNPGESEHFDATTCRVLWRLSFDEYSLFSILWRRGVDSGGEPASATGNEQCPVNKNRF
jgi:hypothetical protein